MVLSLSECTAQCKKFGCDRKPSEMKLRGKGESMTSDGKCKGFKKSKETLVSPEQIEDFGSEMTDNIPDKFQKDIRGRRMS
jgi:hypothetical protein